MKLSDSRKPVREALRYSYQYSIATLLYKKAFVNARCKILQIWYFCFEHFDGIYLWHFVGDDAYIVPQVALSNQSLPFKGGLVRCNIGNAHRCVKDAARYGTVWLGNTDYVAWSDNYTNNRLKYAKNTETPLVNFWKICYHTIGGAVS